MSPHSNYDSTELTGHVVEVYLNGGKRFLGKIRRQSRDGILLYGLPMRVLDTLNTTTDMREELRRMLSTIFVPYVGIEYIDIGGEPIGFDDLYGTIFGGELLQDFFVHPLERNES